MKILYPGTYLVRPFDNYNESGPARAIVVFHLDDQKPGKYELWWTYNGWSQAHKLNQEQQFREILGKIKY